MRWLRFLVGLLLALVLHSLMDNFFPNALAFLDPYIILVIYYSMGGNLLGAIVAGVSAGLVQDAFSGAIFGLHAFALTVCGYGVAYLNSRLMLRGPLAFAGCLLASVVLNELILFILVNILIKQRIELFEQAVFLKTMFTSLFGVVLYQVLTLFLREEPIEATQRPSGW